ncbi:MAG: type 2 isopentenyl-diphosphate Delta-isomerase [Deltaproteobacteria bacterium]|nr:type 2 isopentenyl-diphosphate Delta-isomerase [Deltaproteobacteria bacterium]MBI3388484.1 type 2 isopentenyl-diphosphate Delta-isomerase [Deltaproteobacteria bacterium]
MPASRDKVGAVLRARKNSHLELCQHEDVEYRGKTTLFEDVELLHNALPELALDDLDISVEFLGKRLRAPFVITGMTGGTAEGFAVNRDLATVAERCGIGFGLGSQRVMQRDPATADTFAVREFAPTTLLLANIGIGQASEQSSAEVQQLITAVRADALCVHLNPAQELIQPEGDRGFRDGYRTLARLCADLTVPVIAKETGCGISRTVGERLRGVGVRHVDVSGAGGTSWVRVETLRGNARSRQLGEEFAEWGIPTAASLAMLRGCGLELIASGGIRSGLEIAKALALGARVCGAALPLYRAYRDGGIDAATLRVDELINGLKTAMLLTGSRTLADLSCQPLVLGERIKAWLAVESGGGKG